MPETLLKVGGRQYGGWQSIRIQRGLEQIAGAFELGITERWGGQRLARPIKPGEACQVLVDGAPVITGYVDDVRPAYDKESHRVVVAGRDKAGDLVDCSAIHKSGQWSGRTLAQICADLCAPFGIRVIDRARASEVFPTFAIQEGETAFEALERAARMRSVLLVSDGEGNLIIDRADTTLISVELVEGRNILAAEGEFSWRERFSRYIVKGQAQGDDNLWGVAVAGQKGAATDAAITRYRPLIVLAEDQGHGATFRRRAEWERNVRLGRGNRVTVTVQGWTHPGGLWEPNRLVRVRSPFLDVDADLLIAAVTFTLDERGTRAELALCRREAFDVIAPAKKTQEKSIWP